MNLGQVLETHLGAAAHGLGFRAITPVFDGVSYVKIEDALGLNWISQQIAPESDEPTRDEPTIISWLDERGFQGRSIVNGEQDGEAREACLRLWLGTHGVDDLGPSSLDETVAAVQERTQDPPPILGKVYLRDGRTGDIFDHPVTVGHTYMMKLIHLALG